MYEVLDVGYTVVPGPFGAGGGHEALAASCRAIDGSNPEEVRIGSSCIRTTGILKRAPRLASLLLHEPLLEAAEAIIGGPFKLSAFNARKVRPGASAQLLHQDVVPGADGWPLVGFILMMDAFMPENGATRFVPRSQHSPAIPEQLLRDHPDQQFACGPAGSMIIFHGSAWHGYGANSTSGWRRSVYGSLIPRSAHAAMDHRGSIPLEIWTDFPVRVRALLQS